MQSNLIQLDRMDETTSKVRGAKHVRKRSSIKFKTKQKSGRSQIRQILKSVKNVVEVHKNVS